MLQLQLIEVVRSCRKMFTHRIWFQQADTR